MDTLFAGWIYQPSERAGTMARKAKKETEPVGIRAIFIRNCPDDLHTRFKSKCAAQRISIQDQLIVLIRQYVGGSG
jgi:hypothetical protein